MARNQGGRATIQSPPMKGEPDPLIGTMGLEMKPARRRVLFENRMEEPSSMKLRLAEGPHVEDRLPKP